MHPRVAPPEAATKPTIPAISVNTFDASFSGEDDFGFTLIDETGERMITTIGRKLHPRGHDESCRRQRGERDLGEVDHRPDFDAEVNVIGTIGPMPKPSRPRTETKPNAMMAMAAEISTRLKAARRS